MDIKSKSKDSNGFKQGLWIATFVILSAVAVSIIVSICFTSYVVLAGTQGIVPKIMVAPQAFFAGAVALATFFLAIKNSINSK